MRALSYSGRPAGHYVLVCLILTLLLFIPNLVSARPLQISIRTAPDILTLSVARLAVDDSLDLLRKAFPAATVSLNAGTADVTLVLPQRDQFRPTAILDASRPYPQLLPPDTSFRWQSTRRTGRVTLRLTATTPEGVAAGLYGLLQEKLGIRFIHPRQTLIPHHGAWPLPNTFCFTGQPRFANRGFHLHTLHPTELTEQLHDPRLPNAYADVTAYLDWLARNGQNTFQFFLLRDIDRTAWIEHARKIVDYAHCRGIHCGVEVSLAMLQQQAFQAVTLLRPYPSYRRQVDATLAWLFRAPWDFVTLEATMGEHLPLLGKLLPGVQAHFEQQVTERYRARLLYATHVIGQEGSEKVRRPLLPGSGILIHTVMCYSASEPRAPVYGNLNQCFMLEAALLEARRRECWYWPESSYWVAFDSPVPLLILPYLDSRWDDMAIMAGIGVTGHLTFSSGWEWGYWLIDWSIARWSWRYSNGDRDLTASPLSRLADLFPDPVLGRYWQEALTLQNRFLKERELLRYMAALTPFSESPRPLHRPFQPEPGFSYRWLLNDASREEAQAVLRGPVTELERYGEQMEKLSGQLTGRLAHLERGGKMTPELSALGDELAVGLRVSALRARHRALTMGALIAKRDRGGDRESERLLSRATQVRQEALLLVQRQERHYRYPVASLGRQRPSLTAYSFGYLYPASVLFFWEREEEQVRHNRFDPLFKNLWDFRRTLGLESLILRQ